MILNSTLSKIKSFNSSKVIVELLERSFKILEIYF